MLYRERATILAGVFSSIVDGDCLVVAILLLLYLVSLSELVFIGLALVFQGL
jgi:hypothetical protein